jgi:hypothetical protein
MAIDRLHPLGRHPAAGQHHDPVSRRFPVARTAIRDVTWQRVSPILDQGDLGSCTGNAGTGVLGTQPFFATLLSTLLLNEMYAVRLYSDATKIDPYEGGYPPTDTGSDGLSVAKVLKARGMISGYLHAFDLNAALGAIAIAPVITGINWYSSFDSPDSSGYVKITKDAQVRGGHEVEVLGVDTVRRLVRCANSWGADWADHGYFTISWDDWGRLLSEDGDVTQFVPVSVPAPTPTPTPDPGMTPNAADVALWTPKRAAWAHARHVDGNREAAQAMLAWAAALGLPMDGVQ